MKERPILFSAPMVRAIQDGSKTQTRRVVKAKYLPFVENLLGGFLDGKWNQRPLPYGKPGDRLYVRETWAEHPDFPGCRRAIYRADPECEYDTERWKPSIHMPRWASRILLEIVSVRVERLKECSREDAAAEGVCYLAREGWDERRKVQGGEAVIQPSMWPEQNFGRLWEHINGIGSWDANPWVWVVEFKRVTP